jgi:hypothetical protein
MATKNLSSKAKYIPNRMINEIEVERNGRTTIIDGADLLDGAYVKKTVKFGNGGGTAVSSQSGLAVGTNADLLMNQQNLQYAKGSTVKGGITIHELENRLNEYNTQVVDDKTLDSEEIHNWGADNVTEYKKAQNEIDKIKYKGKGWEIYGWYDVSSFDYWIIKQEEQNYIQITIKFKNETVKEEEVDEIADALDSALADADRIANKYNYNPSKYAKGSTIKGVKPIKVKAYGMDKKIVSLTQKAIDFLQEKFPQYRGEEELDSTEPYWDMVDAVRDNFDTDTPTKYGEIGEEIVRMYLAKENKYAKGSTVEGGNAYVVNYFKEDTSDIETIVVVANSEEEARNKAYDLVGGFDDVADIEEMTIAQAKSMGLLSKNKYAKGSTVKGGELKVGDVVSTTKFNNGKILKIHTFNEDEKIQGKVLKKGQPLFIVQNLDIKTKSDLYWFFTNELTRKMAKGSTVKGVTTPKIGEDFNILDSGWIRYGNYSYLTIDKAKEGLEYAKKQELPNNVEIVIGQEDNLMYNIYYRHSDYGTRGSYVKRVYGNGGGVAVSSENGYVVGTNADLLMNQNYLQYEHGGSMGSWCYEIGGL